MAATKSSKRIVIDASVARSSQGEDAVHPAAINCRNVLQAVLEVCHKVAMSKEGFAEWKRHRSNFARSWLVQMHGKKKVINLAVEPDELLRSKITKKAASKDHDMMLKDCHLLEASLAADSIIISLDDTVRGKFGQASVHVGEIREIMWANPNDQDILEWLGQGANAEELRKLCNYSSLREHNNE